MSQVAIRYSIGQSVSQSASQSASQSISQSVRQSVSQPVSQSVSKTDIQPASQSPVSQSVSQSARVAVSQPGWQSVSQSASQGRQLVSQPYSQSVIGQLIFVASSLWRVGSGDRKREQQHYSVSNLPIPTSTVTGVHPRLVDTKIGKPLLKEAKEHFPEWSDKEVNKNRSITERFIVGALT